MYREILISDVTLPYIKGIGASMFGREDTDGLQGRYIDT